MKRIRSSVRQIVISLLLVYLSALMLATDGCTRTARAAWPSTYGAVALNWATAPWLAAEDSAQLRHWQAVGDGEFHGLLRDPRWGEVFRCAR
ncbi:hypothetical protein [Rhodoferax saidenbachensis]|uniref:Uncharacterized protein n=1 Tax=Rhodoferax saidenbachensis TaxID=1484693 RepID=A0A1P8KDH7_9BURK|nr:hypothetical protein [Rhodoferax saidenbachensis]APW44061.1 hypothetical protein RS694_16985 [Rhodoferax saidenbachensis]